eukprot:3286849-Rhodomonas_salina.1
MAIPDMAYDMLCRYRTQRTIRYLTDTGHSVGRYRHLDDGLHVLCLLILVAPYAIVSTDIQ